MRFIRVLPLPLGLLVLGACSTTSWQARVDGLERERQDLLRQNTQLKADLTACRAKCSSFEQALKGRTGRTEAPEDGLRMPDDLTAQGISVRKNGHGETIINVPSDVFFPSGVSVLSARGKETLARVADLIRSQYPRSKMRVEGHADKDPIRKTKGKFHCNWDLSLDRAHSVMHYLVESKSFKPQDIACVGYGEFRPQDPSDKAKNRRVELVIVP